VILTCGRCAREPDEVLRANPCPSFEWRGYTFRHREFETVIVDHDSGDEDRSE
jgi:hypothetical protein